MRYEPNRFKPKFCDSKQKWTIDDSKNILKKVYFKQEKECGILVDFLNDQYFDNLELNYQLGDCFCRIVELESMIIQLGGEIG